jgi:hypothetical protein
MRTVPGIRFFLQGKNSCSQAWQFSTIQEQPVFLAGSDKPDLRNFNIFFQKLLFYILLFYFLGQKIDIEGVGKQ